MGILHGAMALLNLKILRKFHERHKSTGRKG